MHYNIEEKTRYQMSGMQSFHSIYKDIGNTKNKKQQNYDEK